MIVIYDPFGELKKVAEEIMRMQKDAKKAGAGEKE